MRALSRRTFFLLLTGLVLAFFAGACTPLTEPIATVTASPLPLPTLTPVPLALVINGEGITQPEFSAELARYLQVQAELGSEVTPEEAILAVQEDFISLTLLAQGAAEAGYMVDEAMLQARLDALAEQIGGSAALLTWQSEHGYSEADFRSALRRQMAAAWMRDGIIAAVPTIVEQVHVRQILFSNEEDARNVLALIRSGWDFYLLADQYHPLTRGGLGWFPRGYLDHPTVEEAAFLLQPGTTSDVVVSSVGFHILYLVERDPARALSSDALLRLQTRALEDWLTLRRNASTIEIDL